MSVAIVILVIAIVFFGGGIIALKMLARARASTIVIPEEVLPCYRCASIATTDFMGLHYCVMCRMVVAQMLPAVRHDPPYGFPGSPGYLEFPKQELQAEEKKKEA